MIGDPERKETVTETKVVGVLLIRKNSIGTLEICLAKRLGNLENGRLSPR